MPRKKLAVIGDSYMTLVIGKKINNILITGANGFLGKNFIKYFNSDPSNKVIGLIRDNPDEAIKDYEFVKHDLLNPLDDLSAQLRDLNYVFHIATNSDVGKIIDDPRLSLENIISTFNCLEFCRNINVI